MTPTKQEAANRYVIMVVRPYLESGERLIKSFIGKQYVPFIKMAFLGVISEIAAPWYCFTLTQKHVVLMKMNNLMKPVEIKRIPFEGIESVRFQKSIWGDLCSVGFMKERPLVLRVSHGYRSQVESIVSVLMNRNPK